MTKLLPKNEFMRIFHSPIGQETYRLYKELESSTTEDLQLMYKACDYMGRIAPIIRRMIDGRKAQGTTTE